MADQDDISSDYQEKASNESVLGFKNDGSFLEQFKKLQEQKQISTDEGKPQPPARPIPIKVHMCALKKPTARILPKRTLETKRAFDGDEGEPNTEPDNESASTSAVCVTVAVSESRSTTAPEEGTRKRKSRWSDTPPEKSASLTLSHEPLPSSPTLTPTLTSSSVGLTAVQQQQLLEQIEINTLVAEIQAARKKRGNKFEYDSDEECDDGTWEHKLRAKEMLETEDKAKVLTESAKGKHHIGDFLPPEELERFIEKAKAKKEGREADISDYKAHKLTDDNVGYKMLQKAGWKEGSGLGSSGTGIVAPINKGRQSFDQSGLGTEQPGEVEKDDDAFETYRKRMMLAYRFRPNPLNNPRRPYY